MAEYLSEEDMNTGEYISRDVALRQLNATCLATDCNNYNGVRCRACAYADAMDFIDAIPAANVQPVNRGRWIDIYEWAKMHDSTPSGMCTYYWCSECQKEQEKKSNFCPNCGARMIKDGDTE